MGITRTDIERIQEEAGEEGTPGFSYTVIDKKDGEGKEIDYRALDIHHNRAHSTLWKDLDLTRLQASHTELTGALFYQCTLHKANLDHATFTSASLRNSFLEQATLREATMANAYIENTGLDHADFGSVKAPHLMVFSTHPHWCEAIEVNFGYATLTDASFTRYDLQRANFQRANLTKATFQECDLTGANFSHANLTNTVFTGDCTFTGVDLAYADLTDVSLTLEQLRAVNLLHIRQCFESICRIRTRGSLIDYRKEILLKGLPYSLPGYLGMDLPSHSALNCVEQFSHGLASKKNEQDEPVRVILLEWIDNWLNQ